MILKTLKQERVLQQYFFGFLRRFFSADHKSEVVVMLLQIYRSREYDLHTSGRSKSRQEEYSMAAASTIAKLFSSRQQFAC
jgi:hypothetical protein